MVGVILGERSWKAKDVKDARQTERPRQAVGKLVAVVRVPGVSLAGLVRHRARADVSLGNGVALRHERRGYAVHVRVDGFAGGCQRRACLVQREHATDAPGSLAGNSPHLDPAWLRQVVRSSGSSTLFCLVGQSLDRGHAVDGTVICGVFPGNP